MNDWISLVGPNGTVQLFGVKLVGVNAENGGKLLISVCYLIAVYAISSGLRFLVGKVVPGKGDNERRRFWTRQGIQVLTAVLVLIGLISIWFDDPTRLTAAVGMITAGLAFALQRVVTAVAGYVVILRGQIFSVGDRIAMGGVRGDVIGLRFTQTVIMEMGQPPGEQGDAPSMWVKSRQYTGRIVTVTNAKIFDEPVYNYSRDFPFIWEEMTIPISYDTDRGRAETIIRETAEKFTTNVQNVGEEALHEMEHRYFMAREDLRPHVYWRITDNWVEMTVRFIVEAHGVRGVKDRMSREILARFDEAKIGIASGTYAVVQMPPIEIRQAPALPRS